MASPVLLSQAGSPPILPRTRRTKRPVSRLRRLWRGVVGVLILGAVMEAVSRLGLVDSAFLPPFSTTLLTAAGLLGDPGFLGDLLSTISSWGLGMLITCALAIPLGALLGISGKAYRLTSVLLEIVRTLPAVALIPLVLLLFGQGLGMKLVITVYAATWPILFNTLYGVRGVDPQPKEMARSFGFSRWRVFARVVVPSAAPFVATGIRVASSIGLIVVITVEMLAGATSGIGAFIANARAVGIDPALAYAGALIAGILGLAVNSVLNLIERRVFAWQDRNR